jgi:arylsulfatase A-like enzyme
MSGLEQENISSSSRPAVFIREFFSFLFCSILCAYIYGITDSIITFISAEGNTGDTLNTSILLLNITALYLYPALITGIAGGIFTGSFHLYAGADNLKSLFAFIFNKSKTSAGVKTAASILSITFLIYTGIVLIRYINNAFMTGSFKNFDFAIEIDIILVIFLSIFLLLMYFPIKVLLDFFFSRILNKSALCGILIYFSSLLSPLILLAVYFIHFHKIFEEELEIIESGKYWFLGSLVPASVVFYIMAGIILRQFVSFRMKILKILFLCFSAVVFSAPLFFFPADNQSRIVISRYPEGADKLIKLLQWATDIDHDGSSGLFGGGDCDPFNSDISPHSFDVPDNGVDEDCDGFDLKETVRQSEVIQFLKKPSPVMDRKFNIILLTIDALRRDHVSYFGYERNTTPNLDRFAANNIVFSNAHSVSGYTHIVMPSIFNSMYPSDLPWERCATKGECAMRTSQMDVISNIKKMHYYSAAFILSAWKGLYAKWNDFDTIDSTSIPYKRHLVKGQRTAELATDVLIEWLEKNKKQPFFLWYHYIDPHHPYETYPDFEKFPTDNMGNYDNEIFYTDYHLGRLLDFLYDKGFYEDTVIIITSDHGEAFDDHGNKWHGSDVYNESVKIPVFMHIPSMSHADFGLPVTNLDIGPTILNLAGFEDPPCQLEGISLLPVIMSNIKIQRPIFLETWVGANFESRTIGIYYKDWKGIHNFSNNTWELYNLKDDPAEKNNVYPFMSAGSEVISILKKWKSAHNKLNWK